MKSKILLIALFFVFFSQSNFACPRYLIGKMNIVNENNQFIEAKVWCIYNNDSSLIKKRTLWQWDGDKYTATDTNSYGFYNSYNYIHWENKDMVANRYFRIQAVGYADVIIKDFRFSSEKSKGLPKLVIKMYPKKFYKVGDKLTLIESYAYNKNLIVVDSVELNYSNYLESIESKYNNLTNSDKTLLTVESFPNPITDYILLKINTTITKPYILRLMDMNGNIVNESYLTSQETRYELQSQAKGNYFVQVYDPKGNPVFSRKFVKL